MLTEDPELLLVICLAGYNHRTCTHLLLLQGTPLEGNEAPSGMDLVRCIATSRIVMPRTVVRLSAGRLNLSMGDQVSEGGQAGGSVSMSSTPCNIYKTCAKDSSWAAQLLTRVPSLNDSLCRPWPSLLVQTPSLMVTSYSQQPTMTGRIGCTTPCSCP
jgi:hypothetical protein